MPSIRITQKALEHIIIHKLSILMDVFFNSERYKLDVRDIIKYIITIYAMTWIDSIK